MLLILLLMPSAATASRRIEVYSISQQYHDVQPGETLGEIAAGLLPGNPRLQQKLMQEIIVMNPRAFINGNPDRLIAGRRLWLPNSTPGMQEDRAQTGRVESYQWGSIRRPE